jgi:hypothetical protein
MPGTCVRAGPDGREEQIYGRAAGLGSGSGDSWESMRGMLLLSVSFSSHPRCMLVPITFFSFPCLIFPPGGPVPANFPATNAQGNHVWRQFGLPGTRTVNVCPEKWGGGPVCDQ